MRYVLSFPLLKRLSIDARTALSCLDVLKGHAGIEWKVSDNQVAAIQEMKTARKKIAHIAKVTGLSRPTIYRVLGQGVGVWKPDGGSVGGLRYRASR